MLKLDIDPKTHPAWTGQHRIVDSGGQVARFNKRLQDLTSSSSCRIQIQKRLFNEAFLEVCVSGPDHVCLLIAACAAARRAAGTR